MPTGVIFHKKRSLAGRIVCAVVRRMVTRSGKDMLTGEAQEAPKPSKFVPPRGFRLEQYDAGDVPLELLLPPGEAPKWLVLQIHGGGFVGRLNDGHRKNAVSYSRETGAAVLSFDYRTAPEHAYPAALEDAHAVWRWALGRGYTPQNIALVGDSAGGNLALALLLKLKGTGEALPCAVYCMSPVTDCTMENACYYTQALLDPLFGPGIALRLARGDQPKRLSYVGDADPRDPLLSPLVGGYAGCPPILLQAGTHEVLAADSAALYQKAAADGAEVTLSFFNGMMHAFQFARNMLPESREAWREAGAFLRARFDTQGGA